jgi:glycosyltransferase involved in cell wall biosynthesis
VHILKCRLLYLVGGLGPGGLERQLCFLLQAMDRDRYRPEVVVWSFRNDDTYVSHIRKLGVPLHFFPNTYTASEKLRAFRRMVTRMRPEVIHSYSFYTNFAAWWAVRNTTTIALGSCRSDFTYELKGSGPLLGRLSGRWPRYQITNSLSAATTINRLRTHFVPKRLWVVRNGVDLQTFRALPLPDRQRVTILGIGSLLPVKRWDRLVIVAEELKRRGFDFLILVAGDGPLRESLTQQCQQRGVSDRVQFLGYSDDVPRLLADAAFLIHPSDTEGCPNAVLEAMACGRAVIATDVGDIASLVEDGKTGFVVRSGDDEALVDRIIRLLSDRHLCRRMGEAVRAKAEREFGLGRLVSETLAAYRAVGWRDVF